MGDLATSGAGQEQTRFHSQWRRGGRRFLWSTARIDAFAAAPALTLAHAKREPSATREGGDGVSLAKLRALWRIDAALAKLLVGGLPSDREVGRAAREAQALADPDRILLPRLMDGGEGVCASDLASMLGAAAGVPFEQSRVSHQLGVLRRAGLARSWREGNYIHYELTRRGAEPVEAVIGRDRHLRHRRSRRAATSSGS